MKVADKLYNLRDTLSNPPAKWSEKRKRQHFAWAKAALDQVQGLDAAYVVGTG